MELLPARWCRAERGSGGFWSGFLVGGVVCGALGFVFAPQVSRGRSRPLPISCCWLFNAPIVWQLVLCCKEQHARHYKNRSSSSPYLPDAACSRLQQSQHVADN